MRSLKGVTGPAAIAGGPRRIDDQQACDAIGVRDGQLQGQLAAHEWPASAVRAGA